MSRMDEMLSRSKNGAVNVGNTDLILPVRVRTCAENVGKTPGAFPLRGSVASAFQHMERSEEASQRYSEGWRVGLSDPASPRPDGEAVDPAPAGSPGEKRYGYPLRHFGCWASSFGDKGVSSRPVKSHVVSALAGRVSATHKAQPKRSATRRTSEAVSGSRGSWDGSSAVVVPARAGMKRKTVVRVWQPVVSWDS